MQEDFNNNLQAVIKEVADYSYTHIMINYRNKLNKARERLVELEEEGIEVATVNVSALSKLTY